MLIKSLIISSAIFVSLSVSAESVYLDIDTPTSGSELDTSPLITSLGTISFIGVISDFTDPDLTAVGAAGNLLNINGSTDDSATLSFSFDVDSVSFIFGGNGGAFDIVARDALGNTIDSYFGSTDNGDFAGPLTLSGGGIRSLFWQDPGWNFAGIDNITISTSPVPVPAAVWLLGSALLGLSGLKRKK